MRHQPFGSAHSHLFVLNRARAGDDREMAIAEGPLSESNGRIMGVHLATGQLVRLGDPDQLEHARQDFESPRIDRAGISRDPDGCSRGTRHRVRRQAHLANRVDDPLNLVRRRMTVHDDEHQTFSCRVPRSVRPSRESTNDHNRFAG